MQDRTKTRRESAKNRGGYFESVTKRRPTRAACAARDKQLFASGLRKTPAAQQHQPRV